ncbi:MAG: hypothetical protein FJX63_00075 [Alphaproteobacteria bacterium]|nr:hypothetical protein [Alphaproteobacteria bacterium]
MIFLPGGAAMEVRGCCSHDCQDSCAWIAHAENGVVTSVEGAKDHPITRGVLCAKVRDYEQRLTAKNRLLFPMRRAGPKGSGQFVRIGWDEAFAEIARRFRAIVAEHGGAALLPYNYLGSMGTVQRLAPMRIFHALGSSIARGDVCSASAGALMEEGHPIGLDPEESVDARLVVIWGQNTLSTAHHQWHFIDEARKKGARVIGIDPRATRTMRQCDVHLAPRPGSDAILAAALGRHLLETGRADLDLARLWVADLDSYRRAVAPWTFAAAAEVTRLSAEAIEAFAREFAAAIPVLIRAGVGLQQARNGEDVIRAISALAILGGHWRHRGGGLSILSFPAYSSRAADRGDLRKGEPRIVHGAKLAQVLTDRTLDPAIKGFMVWSANPAATQIDAPRMREGLLRDDLFTVVADHFLTDTARLADIVLPATTQFEHVDVQFAWGHYYVMANNPAIAPMGEAQSSGAIMRGLAAALCLDDPAFRQSDEEIAASTMPEGWPFTDLLAAGWRKSPAPRPAIADRARKLAITPANLAESTLPAGTLQLLTPKGHYFLNSNFANMPRQRQSERTPTLKMSEGDAAARKLADGARVTVTSNGRALSLRLAVSPEVGPGCVALDGKWWNDEAGANVLTSSLWSPGGQPAYNEVYVTVEAAG